MDKKFAVIATNSKFFATKDEAVVYAKKMVGQSKVYGGANYDYVVTQAIAKVEAPLPEAVVTDIA